MSEFCPKCGKKTFEYTGGCEQKYRCTDCGYFLLSEDFEELKRKKEGDC